MGCLSVKIDRIGLSPTLSINRIGGMCIDISMVGKPLKASVLNISKHLKVTCGFVCSVHDSLDVLIDDRVLILNGNQILLVCSSPKKILKALAYKDGILLDGDEILFI